MKPNARKFLRGYWLLSLVLLAWPVHGQAQLPNTLLVVEVSEADHAAAQRLLELTEQPTQLVRMESARDPREALPLAGTAGAATVLVLDQEAARVTVLRVRDGAQLTRTTQAVPGSPYVAAFVAVELLALSRATPLPPPPRVTPRPDTAVVSPRRQITLGARAGAELLPLAPYRGAARPVFGLLASVGPADATVRVRLELSAMPLARLRESTPSGRLTVTRHDFAARAGLLWESERLSLSAYGQLGMALREAAWRGSLPTRERQQAFVAGVGVEPSLKLWRYLSLYASCTLSTSTPPVRYRAAGQSIVDERRVLLTTGLGLLLALPLP